MASCLPAELCLTKLPQRSQSASRRQGFVATNLCYKIVFLPGMNLVDVLLLSLAAVFIIIGIYENMALGLGQAYWAIMLSVGFFFLYWYRKKRKS